MKNLTLKKMQMLMLFEALIQIFFGLVFAFGLLALVSISLVEFAIYLNRVVG